MGVTYIPYNPQADWKASLGSLLGTLIQNNINNGEKDKIVEYMANLRKSAETPTADDQAAAKIALLKQNGYGNVVGQDGLQVLYENKAKWDALQQIRGGYDQNSADKAVQSKLSEISSQQDALRSNSDTIRNLLSAKGFDVSSIGSDAPAEAVQRLMQAKAGMSGVVPGMLDSPETSTAYAQNLHDQQALAHGPSTVISFDDINKGGKFDNDIAKLAALQAKTRTRDSWDANSFMNQVNQDLVKMHLSSDNLKYGLGLAQQYADAQTASIRKARNDEIESGIVAAIQNGDQRGKYANIVKFAIDNGLYNNLPEYMRDSTPNMQVHDTNAGNVVRQTFYDPKGLGNGFANDIPVGTNPNTIAENANREKITRMNNDTQVLIEQYKENNANYRAKLNIEAKNGTEKNEQLAAAKDVISAYNDFEKSRMPGDKTMNPYSGMMDKAKSVLGAKMGPSNEMSPRMQQFMKSLQDDIAKNGPEKTKAWIRENASQLKATGIDPDIALTWIP